jgi:hypothetical protein
MVLFHGVISVFITFCILNFWTLLYLFHFIIYNLLAMMLYNLLTDQDEDVHKDSCWRYNLICGVSLLTKHPSSISYVLFLSKIPADWFLVLNNLQHGLCRARDFFNRENL